ncbi:hypothetical protein [Glycomyces sp. NPDC047010]|uniref:hypothetical protein n=1 Tax=Glycomyces sp. NPDC047010 TaxID=3155023 RepID=UPI0033C642B1
MSTDTTVPEQTDRTHAARMAATICERDWDTVLERLPWIDGYQNGPLTDAAIGLHAADAAATEAIGYARAAQDTYGSLTDQHRRQLEGAEEALAVCGYLHPSRVRLLGETAEAAITARHDARGALADLLYTARTVLEDA